MSAWAGLERGALPCTIVAPNTRVPAPTGVNPVLPPRPLLPSRRPPPHPRTQESPLHNRPPRPPSSPKTNPLSPRRAPPPPPSLPPPSPPPHPAMTLMVYSRSSSPPLLLSPRLVKVIEDNGLLRHRAGKTVQQVAKPGGLEGPKRRSGARTFAQTVCGVNRGCAGRPL